MNEGDQGDRPASHDSHSLRSWYAMEALRRLGTDTIPALPELKLLLNNNTNRLLALKAYCVLEKLKGVAIPTLVEAAENRHHPAHDSIVGYFCHLAFGPQRATVMPTLTRLLQDPDPAIQARASNASNRISSGQDRYPPLTLTRRASGMAYRNGEGELDVFVRKLPGTKGPRVWRP